MSAKRIIDPFQMNDWGIWKFLTVIAVWQLAVWILIGLDSARIEIPFFRQVIPLVYMCYVPGILILRIMKLHQLGISKTIIYSVGMSIATTMFIGAILNILLLPLGIKQPLALIPLASAMTGVIALLAIISYFRDHHFEDPAKIDLNILLSPQALFLYILPLFSILAALVFNTQGSIILLVCVVIIIALVMIITASGKVITRNFYPLAAFSIALSLLYFRTVVSNYVIGGDIHYEFYLASLVVEQGFWSIDIPAAYNAMLSIITLSPTISIISGMELSWVFKLIYPVILALVPLGLYSIFLKQTNSTIAIIGTFFFISMAPFFDDLSILPRQLIATIFIVYFITAIIDEELSPGKRLFFLIISSISIVVSHYGTAFIFLFCLVPAKILLHLIENGSIQRFFNSIARIISNKKGDRQDYEHLRIGQRQNRLSIFLILAFICFGILWYTTISSSRIANDFVGILGLTFRAMPSESLVSQIPPDLPDAIVTDGTIVVPGNDMPDVTEPLEPATPAVLPDNTTDTATISGFSRFIDTATEKLNILFPALKEPPVNIVRAAIIRLSQIFIVLGFITFLFVPHRFKFYREFIVLAFGYFLIYLSTIAPPFFSSLMPSGILQTTRISHMTYFFVVPFGAIGAFTALKLFKRLFTIWGRVSIELKYAVVVATFFAALFVYQTGLVWLCSDIYPGVTSLGIKWAKENGNPQQKAAAYGAILSEQDVTSARWLSSRLMPGEEVYATYDDLKVHALTSYGMISSDVIPRLTRQLDTIPDNAYVYLQSLNVIEGIATETDNSKLLGEKQSIFDIEELQPLYAGKNRIYSNGDTEIYR